MFFWRHDEKPQGPIYDWLLDNKEQIHVGTAVYMGTPVNESTEFFQYKYVISFGLATLSLTTPHDLPTAANGQLKLAPWKYALISLLFGWWCFPWGPPFTIHALFVTLSGGRKRTAASLLQLVEWGWDAPQDVSTNAHRKDILAISDGAAAEIRSRMANGDFPQDIGVRITPTKWADAEVEITFDYPVSDGRDWVDESQGLLLLIDKNHEFQLCGRQLDYRDGRFTSILAPTITHEAHG